jgi:hypothetical protein
VNKRKLTGALGPRHCRSLEHAWIEAAQRGRPLNRKLTIKPLDDLSPAANAELVERLWNKLGGWSRYHGGGQFFCILVHEKHLARPEHIHVLADYLYLGQLPSLLFTPDAWQQARQRLGGTADGKQRLHGMDPGKLVMKWKTPHRIIDRFVEFSMAQAVKGSVFFLRRLDSIPILPWYPHFRTCTA